MQPSVQIGRLKHYAMPASKLGGPTE
jgi:hypothetical protein